jgi:ATP-binding cassette, subfamily B, bacterial PglK
MYLINYFLNNEPTRFIKGHLLKYGLLSSLSAVVNMTIIWFIAMALSFLSGQDNVLGSNFLSKILNYFYFDTEINFELFILIFSVTLMPLNLFLQMYRIIYMNSLARRLYLKISNVIYKKFAYMKYIDFVLTEPADLRAINLSEIQEFVNNIFKPILEIIASIIILIALVIILSISVNAQLLFSCFAFIILFSVMFIGCRKIVKRAGLDRLQNNRKRYEIFDEQFNNFKYLSHINQQSLFEKKFFESSKKVAHAFEKINLFSQIPSVVIQNMAFGIIMIMGLMLYASRGTNETITFEVTALALASLRMLPEFSKLSVSMSILQANSSLASKIITSLMSAERFNQDTYIDSKTDIKYFDNLKMNQISFSYKSKNSNVLNDLSFEVKSGEHIVIVGATGSGKSTIIDIILGLLEPDEGHIELNGIKYASLTNLKLSDLIAYIPQKTTLLDESAAVNITLNYDKKYDVNKLRDAYDVSCCSDFLNFDDGSLYQNRIGSDGALLSGGQRQRLAIARALYSGAKVMLCDEAFNALDESTRSNILVKLRKRTDITIIEITHDLYNIPPEAKVLCLNNGCVSAFGRLTEINKDPTFQKLFPIINKTSNYIKG